MGFCDGYKEVQHFEHAVISNDEPSYNLGNFSQFVFDNADFNVGTITGHNTLHSMGGIVCVSPPGEVTPTPVKRLMKLSSANAVGTFGQIPTKTYTKPAIPGLQSVIMLPLKRPGCAEQQIKQAMLLDSLWTIGYILEANPFPSWSGFMKVAMEGSKNDYDTARIETLPFINLNKSNPYTI